jgi:hypothetical protein
MGAAGVWCAACAVKAAHALRTDRLLFVSVTFETVPYIDGSETFPVSDRAHAIRFRPRVSPFCFEQN